MAYKWNPRKLTGSFKGTVNGRDFAVQFEGYMDGTHVTAEFDEDAASKHIGNTGQASVVLNANEGAKITIVLSQGSPSNDQLSDLVPNARLDYLPVGTLTFDDLNGSTAILAAEAWLIKKAKIEYSKEIMGREWTFDTGLAEIHVGGAEAQ